MFERGSQMRSNYDLSTFLRSFSGRELNASHLKEEMNAVFKFSVFSVLFNPKGVALSDYSSVLKSSNFVWGPSAALCVAVRVVSQGIYSSSIGKKNKQTKAL